ALAATLPGQQRRRLLGRAVEGGTWRRRTAGHPEGPQPQEVTMRPEPRPTWLLTIEALPADTPAIIRLRALLKHAGRALRLRCIKVVEAPPVLKDPGDPSTPVQGDRK